MTSHQLPPVKPAVPAPLSFTPPRGGLLQRKCACGGTTGLARHSPLKRGSNGLCGLAVL